MAIAQSRVADAVIGENGPMFLAKLGGPADSFGWRRMRAAGRLAAPRRYFP